MYTRTLHRFGAVLALSVAAMLTAATPAAAAVISWATWTSGTVNATAGTATGTIPGLGAVTYTGEMAGFDGGLDWLPVTSFTGGIVGNAPPSGPGVANDGIALVGGGTVVNTVTFAAPVLNPVLAIWSLGSPTTPARFAFGAGVPFSIQAGGPNSEFGGATIFAGGACPLNNVCGSEGNGVVQFLGTFGQISWTNPLLENYYAFTVGAPSTTVPEPASLLLLGAGLAAARARRWVKTRR